MIEQNRETSSVPGARESKYRTLEERVLVRRTAKFWNPAERWDRPDGELIVTPEQILFRASVPSRSPYVSIPIKKVNDTGSSWFWGFIPAIRFSAGGKS